MKYFLGVFTALFLLLIFPKGILAQVVINEFSSNSNPEWIELYNGGSSDLDLTGWTLADEANPPKPLSGNITAHGYFVFENSQGWLNNSGGDSIILKDSSNSIVDTVVYGKSDSVVGTPDSDKSAGRIPNGSTNWQNNLTPTKGAENPQPTPTPTSTPTPTPSPTPTSTPTPVPTSTPTPTPTKTPTPVPAKTTNPTPRVLAQATDDNQNSIDKMRQTLASPTPTTLVSAEETTKKKFPLLSLLFISSGLALIGWVGYNYLQNRQSQYNEDDENGLRPL